MLSIDAQLFRDTLLEEFHAAWQTPPRETSHRELRVPALYDSPLSIYHLSHALVAQLDRASDFESEGRRFEPCRVHQLILKYLQPPQRTQCRSRLRPVLRKQLVIRVIVESC